MTINGSINGCSAQKTSLTTENKIDLSRTLGFGDFKSLTQLRQSLIFFSSIKKTRGDSSRRVSNCKLQLTSTLKTAYVLASKPTLVIEKLSIAFVANVRFKLINFQMRNRQIKTA